MKRGPASRADAARHLDEAAGHMRAGRLDAAARAYELAERCDPADFRAPMSLATIALRQGRLAEAAPRLRRAATLKPDLFEAWNNLGGVAQALERWDEAALAYERALALRPEALEAERNLAIILAVLGRIDEAAAHHRRLAGQPATRLWALTRLALLRPDELTDADVADVRGAAESALTDTDARTGLWFALGEVLERRGLYDEAFAAFANGNRMKRAALADSGSTNPQGRLRAHAEAARRVRAMFTAERLHGLGGVGLSTSAPIFIVGMPRSGSTLLEQILASHPQVTGLGETGVLPRLLERAPLAGGAGKAELRALALRYLDAMRERGWRGSGRFVDKTLENYLHVGAIAAMFPGATILHARRDPAETCLSCYRQLFASGAETLYDLADIGAEYVVYRGVMDHWARMLPARVVDVDHDALVAAPETQIRRLVTETCALSWCDACLAFHESRRPVRTASGAQVRSPITELPSRWRRYETHLAPLFAALGPYAPPR